MNGERRPVARTDFSDFVQQLICHGVDDEVDTEFDSRESGHPGPNALEIIYGD